MNVPINCSMCLNSEETPLHIFRDCSSIEAIWKVYVPTNFQAQFFSVNFEDWVNANLAQSKIIWEGVEWSSAFLIVCSGQWRH